MVATLPFPIEFSLPEGWRSVNPDSIGADGPGFVALHTATSGPFTANITISGEVRDSSVSLEQIADETVARLRQTDPNVEVGKREHTGSPASPGFTQALRFRPVIEGSPREVYQLQALLGALDRRDPGRRAVLHVAMTALPEQFAQLMGDFGKFLSTIRFEGSTA